MAEAAKEVVVKDAMDRQWIYRALVALRAMLIRSRGKEAAGSEIWTLRGREIDTLSTLMSRFQ